MISYTPSQDGFSMEERSNQEDYEFTIKIQDIDRHVPSIKNIREFFEKDEIVTDVMFYVHQQHEYRIIVRKDFYIDFILALFKYRFIENMKWDT